MATPLLDLENSNDNASSLEFDDCVRNFDCSSHDQGVQIDCEKTQQEDDETQGEFGSNEDGHWRRLVPFELKMADVCIITKNKTLKQDSFTTIDAKCDKSRLFSRQD
jgi:hypothetical protein